MSECQYNHSKRNEYQTGVHHTHSKCQELPSRCHYPWAYEMRVEDLDGHVLRIGSGPKEDEPHNG